MQGPLRISFRLAWQRLTELSKIIAAALLALDRTFGDLGAKLLSRRSKAQHVTVVIKPMENLMLVMQALSGSKRREAGRRPTVILLGVVAMLMAGVALASSAADDQVTDQRAIGQLLDNLHRTAAHSEAQQYFENYTDDAFFLGTDASERWAIEAFKQYADQPFKEGRGWRYEVVARNIMTTVSANVYAFDEVLSNEKLGLCRGSGVVVFDGERWRIAHYVLSMLIPNPIAAKVGNETKRWVDGSLQN